MNSVILCLLNGEYQELVLSLSNDGGALRGVLQPTLHARVKHGSPCNTGSAHEGVADLGVLAPLFDFPGEDAQSGYRRQFIIIARTPGDVKAFALRGCMSDASIVARLYINT